MVSRRFRGECDESRLRSFLHDDLPEPENVRLTDHLDHCENCQRALERLAAGSRLWEELRELSPDFGHAVERRAPVTMDHSSLNRDGAKTDPLIPIDFLAPATTPGTLGRLGPYDVTQVLGRGGFGVVLKAFDSALGRSVAIKVLASPLAASASARSRFAREAKAAAAVVHENVVAIHAVDSWNGLPYLVMQCVVGRSLQERVDQDGPLAVKEVLRIGMQAALGLAAAHAQGLVHRDIKPSNILLENGVERVKLSDFGLARAVDDASLTQSSVIAGTPQYMSPEQARGEAVDHRSDLFGLGSVLYFMCTGHPPFRADSTPAVLRRVCDDRPRPLREVNSDVPGWLAEIVERLHAKEPGERYASATEVADVLQHHLSELQQTGTSTSLRPTRRRSSTPILRRKSTTAILLTSVVLFAGILTGVPGRLYALLPNPNGNGAVAGGAGIMAGGAGDRALAPADNPAPAPIVGSGVAASKAWDVANFNALQIGSTFRAEIVKGDAFKVTTTSDDNVVEHIRIVKDGMTLKVALESGKSFQLKTPLKVEITLPVLESLDLGGASRATLKGSRTEKEFRLKIEGASTVDGSIDVASADFALSGASTATLKGSAKTARISAGGASHLKLRDFVLNQGPVILNGASTAQVTVRTEGTFKAGLSGSSSLEGVVEAGDLDLEVDGASRATLQGSAKNAKIKAESASQLDLTKLSLDAKTVNIVASTSTVALHGKCTSATVVASGASQLRLSELAAENADVAITGASHVTVNVKGELKYVVSFGSILEYSGAPTLLTGTKTGGGQIRQRQ